jgi:lipopolysaccharide export LptBFGC system permease protein LptF
MKTKLIVTAIVWLAGSLAAEAWAQETLKALVKKCETADLVRMSIISNRNKEKKLVKKVTTITILNDDALVNEFIKAFEKDENEALQVISNKQGGKTNNVFYRFEGATYNFSIQSKGNASVSVIEQDGTNADQSSFFFSNDVTNSDDFYIYNADSSYKNLPEILSRGFK